MDNGIIVLVVSQCNDILFYALQGKRQINSVPLVLLSWVKTSTLLMYQKIKRLLCHIWLTCPNKPINVFCDYGISMFVMSSGKVT